MRASKMPVVIFLSLELNLRILFRNKAKTELYRAP